MISGTPASDQSTKSPYSKDNFFVGSPEILKQQGRPRCQDYNYFHNSSHNNLSFTHLNPNSFEIEDPPHSHHHQHQHHHHHHHNLPLFSPQLHSYDYHPQSLLSKRREEGDEEEDKQQQQQQWACNWQHQSNNNNHNEQMVSSQPQQQQQQLNQPSKDSMWETSFIEGGMQSQFNSYLNEENMIGNNCNILNTSLNSGVNNMSNNNSFLANTPRMQRNDTRARGTTSVENHNQILHSEFPGEFHGINHNYNSSRSSLNGMDIEARNEREGDDHHPNLEEQLIPMLQQTSSIVMNYDTYQQKTKLKQNHNILRGYDDNNNDEDDQDTEESPSNLLPEQITTSHSTLDNKPSACFCNCKKTKCLKLYCECFAKLGFCGSGCHCQDCYNKPGQHQNERMQAIQDAKLRNPDAFQSKASASTISGGRVEKGHSTSKRGCNCRKTKCLKKYCECFNSGEFCGISCKCEGCLNKPGVSKKSKDNPQNRRTDNTSSLAIVQSYETMQRGAQHNHLFCAEAPQIVQKYESQNVGNSRRNMCFQAYEEGDQEHDQEISSSMLSSVSYQSMQKRRQNVVAGGVGERTNVRISKQNKQNIFSSKKQHTSDEENYSNYIQSNGSLEETTAGNGKSTEKQHQEENLNSAEKEEQFESCCNDDKQQYLEDLEKKLLQIQQAELLLQQKQQRQEISQQNQDSKSNNNMIEDADAAGEKKSQEAQWMSKKEQFQHHRIAEDNSINSSNKKINLSELRKKKKRCRIERQHLHQQQQSQQEQQFFSGSKGIFPQNISSLRLLDQLDSQSAGAAAGTHISSNSGLQHPEWIRTNGILRTGLEAQNLILTAPTKTSSSIISSSNIFNDKFYSYYPQASANLFEPSTYTRPQQHSSIVLP